MFESLIKSILDKVAGEYIQGLNKENLSIGIFSGDVKIENVSLNPSVIDMLELPLSIRFSKINKLELKVPFKNLGSKPVEVFLDGLYLVLNPKAQTEWTFKDYRAVKEKLSNVEAFAAECISKINAKQIEKSKQGNTTEDAGYLQKLTMKIVDNIQLTIKNIHIRFEDTISNRFSWGFCLDSIEIYTTNTDGKKSFVDRTDSTTKAEPMRKLLVISNAGFYWNAAEQRMLSMLAEEQKLKIMNGMIQRVGQLETQQEPVDFLFKISSQISLVMNNKGNFDVPEIKAILNLEHITLSVSQRQLQQTIELVEYISKYQSELSFRKRNEKKLDAAEIEQQGALFSKHLTKMMSNEKDKSINSLNAQEREEFEKALVVLEIEVLHERIKKVVIEVQKALKIKELEKKKQDEKKGFFGKLFGSSSSSNSGTNSSSSSSLVTEEEKNQIDIFINENFGAEVIDAPLIIRPEWYVFFVLDFNLQGASIKLSNRIGQEINGLLFSINHLHGRVQLRDSGNEIDVKLDSLNLSIINEFLLNNTSKEIAILSPTHKFVSDPLIKFKMISKPLDQKHIDSIVDLKMRSVRFDYNSFLVIRLQQFLDVNVKDDQLKQQAKEKFQETLEQQQNNFSKSMQNASILNLNVDLESSIVVLPFKTDGSLSNECWVLNLGDLSVCTEGSLLKPNLSQEEKALDMYKISLSKIKLSYYPSVEYYNTLISLSNDSIMRETSKLNLNKLYNTIEEFSILIDIAILKSFAQGKINKSNLAVKGRIDQINLKLKPSIYAKLTQLAQCFEIPLEDQQRVRRQTLEEVELEKKMLLKNSSKSGIIFKRSAALKTWEKYSAVLSNGYVYLFANPKDLKPVEYVWIKNSIITTLDEDLVGFKNAFNVKNKYTDIYFACEKEKASQQWIEALEQVKTAPTNRGITDQDIEELIHSQSSAPDKQSQKDAVSTEPKKDDFNQIQVEASFSLGKVQLNLFDEVKFIEQPFLIFSTNQLSVFFEQRLKRMEVKLGLGGMFLTDYLYNYRDPSLQDFITSKSSNKQDDLNELIQVDLLMLEKDHPTYKGIGLNVDLKLNTIIVNFKPDTLAKVMLFIKVNEDQKQQLEIEQIVEMNGKIGAAADQLDASSMTSTQLRPKVEAGLQETDSILFQAQVKLREIKVVMINRRTKLPVGDLSISNIDMNFQQRADEIFLVGSLGNLQLRDLTNFPNTIYREEDYQKIVPNELIGLQKSNGASSLLEVEFRLLNDGSKKIQQDNVCTFIKVNFNSIHINYVQRPILRLIDFIMIQILGPLSTPQFFVDSSHINEEERIKLQNDEAKSKDPMESLKILGKRQVSQDLETPKGMSLDVVIQNPLILLKPTPTSPEYLEVDLGRITVTNKRCKDAARLLDCEVKSEINEVYSDHFLISLADMQLRLIRNNNIKSEMTKSFDYNIDLSMAGFVNEFKFVYGDTIRIDTTMFIYNYITPIIFRLSNSDYNIVMKCIFHNVTHDDGCDRFLEHDWERNQQAQIIIQQKRAKEEERRRKEQKSTQLVSNTDKSFDKEQGGMFCQVDIESFSVFALENETNIPIARVTLGNMRVIQEITPKCTSTNVYATTLNGSYFKRDGQTFQEGSLLGDVNTHRRYDSNEVTDLTFLVNHSLYKDEEDALKSQKRIAPSSNSEQKYSFPQSYPSTATAHSTKHFQIVFELSIMPNADKAMKILVADFKLYAEVKPLLALAGLAQMDEATTKPIPPVFSIVLSTEEQESIDKAKREIEQFTKQVGGETKMDIQVKNVIICTPCPDSVNVIAIRGVFDLQFLFLKTQSIEFMKDVVLSKKSSLEDSYLCNTASMINADLKGLEIFICNVNDLRKKTFKKVNKRSILLPLDLHLAKQDYLTLASMQATLFSTKTVINTNLNKTSLKIAMTDLTIINTTLQLILADLNESAPKNPEQKEDKANINSKNAQANLSEEDKWKKELEDQENKLVVLAQNEEQINQMDLTADLRGFQIVIVNDMNNSFVPVLDFNIFEMQVSLAQNNILLKVTTAIQFSADYYNPRVGLWEPVIERVGFSVDFMKSDLNTVRQLITVEMNPNYPTFNVTFSTQFLSILTKTTKTVKKEIIQTTSAQTDPILLQERKLSSNSSSSNSSGGDRASSDESVENTVIVSPYTVRNETGYPIEVVTDVSKVLSSESMSLTMNVPIQNIYKLDLKNGQEKFFQVDTDHAMMGQSEDKKTEQNVFKKNSEQVRVRVIVPGSDLKFVDQIDLDKVRNRLRVCHNAKTNKKQFEIITEVKLDNQTSKKILNISSPFSFFNGSKKNIEIQVYDSKKVLVSTLQLVKGQKIPVPIDQLAGSFSIGFGGQVLSEKLQFSKLVEKDRNSLEETKVGEQFVMVKTFKDPQNEKRTIFSIDPPYKIKNSLPKALVIQLLDQKKLTSTTQVVPSGESFEFFNCSQQKDSFLRVQIPGHFWSNESKVSSGQIEKLYIKDFYGNLSELSVQQRSDEVASNNGSSLEQQKYCSGSRTFIIYCKGYLINESPYKLQVYTSNNKSKKEYKLVGGQKQIYHEESLNTNIILFGQDTGDLLSLSDSKNEKISKPTSIGGVGNTQIDLFTLNEAGVPVYQTMGISVQLKNVDQEEQLFSKVITISPRFIIVNKTGMQIEVKQKGQDEKVSGIETGTRVPLYWYNESESRFLNVRLIDENKHWNWSGNLNVLELGTVNFMCRNVNNKHEIAFMRFDVRSDDSNIFIVIEKLADNERPFLIQNLCSNIDIELTDLAVTLAPKSLAAESNQLHLHQYHFSWDEPFDKERKVVSTLLPRSGNFKHVAFTFSPDQIYFQDKLEIPSFDNPQEKIYIKWSIDIDGFTRIVRFEDSSQNEAITKKEKALLRKNLEKEQRKKQKERARQEKQKQKELKKAQKEGKEISISMEQSDQPEDIEEHPPVILSQLSVFLKEFGLSIVQNHRMHEKPKEIMYITMKGLEFITVTKEDTQTLQARIKLINIDQNNTYSLVNPVIFTPSKFAQYSSPTSKQFFINVLLEQNLAAKNITLYNNVAIEIDPFTVRIEDSLLATTFDFLKAIDEAKYDPEEQSLNQLKEYLDENAEIERNQISQFKWEICEIPVTSLPTFVNQLILSNIDIALTFKSKVKANEHNMNMLKSLFNALGVVVSDIDASIKLKGIKLSNCFESVNGIVTKLTVHFKNQAITEVLKVFGSLNIIGNPVGLFQNISSGVTDLITKPAEGFVKGPLEGGLGIMEGAGSLIKNTMAGAFNSVNKITGSLSSGISSLCMDQKYLEQRDRMRSKKPKHIVDGAVQGVTSIFSGVANGITGIFLQPFQGAQKGGAKGLLKGIGKGIAGIIVKPVSGVLDAASAAAEGIKNTITYNDDKANENRLRYPRVFYGRDGFYKEFVELDAGMKVAMQLVSKGKFSDADFLQTFLIESAPDKNGKTSNMVLVLTYEVIMLFEQSKAKKKWYFPSSIISHVQLKDNGVHFTTNQTIKKVKEKQVFVQIPLKEQASYVFDQVSTLRHELEDEKKVLSLDN